MAGTIVASPPSLHSLNPGPLPGSLEKRSSSFESSLSFADENEVTPLRDLDEAPQSPERHSSFPTSSGSAASSAAAGPGPSSESNRERTLSTSIEEELDPEPHQPTIARLEEFSLIVTLGKGCAGRVLLVKHAPTNTIHAMKAISKRSVFTQGELVHTMTELAILKRFAVEDPDNPFIVKLNYSFTDPENFYLVMDFYPGGDLATQMEEHGILGHHRTRFYAADIVEALEDLHRHGIIVRDLKPENILLNAKGHAVLADFGLSKRFPYRGDPQPVHVASYPQEPVLPAWAGGGAGSLRLQPNGEWKTVIDRAYAFVGTTEYLSPEVVRRRDYSYAVDWWALGCIILEGMIGRVPFKQRKHEIVEDLWNRILFVPWEHVFLEPGVHPRSPAHYGLDRVTMDLIGALLQKDPMRRLTEPHVKHHQFFTYIDWDIVRAGDYEDPHDLELHPVVEYNTRYFPRLCLDEAPSVDMSTHDKSVSYRERTPMNDELLYVMSQSVHQDALEAYSWSREMNHVDRDANRDSYQEAWMTESTVSSDFDPQEDQHMGEDDSPIDNDGKAVEVAVNSPETAQGVVHSPIEDDNEAVEVAVNSPEAAQGVIHSPIEDDSEAVEVAVNSPETAHGAIQDSQTDFLDDNDLGTPSSPPTAEADAFPTEAKVKEEIVPPIEIVSKTAPAYPLPAPILIPSPMQPPSQVSLPSASSGPEPQWPTEAVAWMMNQGPPSPVPPGAIWVPVVAEERPNPATARPISAVRTSPDVRLPSGLPAGGLSVSDLVSLPSTGSPKSSRIIARRNRLNSTDSLPLTRLSVEMHGRITNIDEEGWEAVDFNEIVGESPNGILNSPSASTSTRLFPRGLGQMIRRKPSTMLKTSGLRRQIRSSSSNSNTASTASTSPIKQGQPPNNRPPLFSAKSFEATKKAFGKFRVVSSKTSRKINSGAPLPPLPLSASLNESQMKSFRQAQTGDEEGEDVHPLPPLPSSSSESTVDRVYGNRRDPNRTLRRLSDLRNLDASLPHLDLDS
ncbi:hypothetical protein P7C73_g4760, partial [Tremellales sp. Uapishka_1]